MSSQKHLNNFFIQTSINVLKKIFCWKITFIWKMIKIMLEAFVSKCILCVHQNVRWNQIKTTQKYTWKKNIFLLKAGPPIVLSPYLITWTRPLVYLRTKPGYLLLPYASIKILKSTLRRQLSRCNSNIEKWQSRHHDGYHLWYLPVFSVRMTWNPGQFSQVFLYLPNPDLNHQATKFGKRWPMTCWEWANFQILKCISPPQHDHLEGIIYPTSKKKLAPMVCREEVLGHARSS
jgi:hypothetical protein